MKIVQKVIHIIKSASNKPLKVAFLEPKLNGRNTISVYNALSIKDRQILGLPTSIEHLAPNLPSLKELLRDIENLANSGTNFIKFRISHFISKPREINGPERQARDQIWYLNLASLSSAHCAESYG